MSDSDNDRFARIALELGFCSAQQIEHCLKIQSITSEGLSLGQSLLREGFLSDAQYSKILEVQRKARGSRRRLPRRRSPGRTISWENWPCAKAGSPRRS